MAFKRKSTALGLERRVRPRKEDKWEKDPESQGSSSEDDDDEVEEEGVRGQHDEDDEQGSDSEEGSEEESEPEEQPKVDLSSISFGALAKAQASLPSSSRHSKSSKPTTESSRTEETKTPAPRKPTRSKDDPKPKRSSKHAPQEQTSKKPVSRRREIVPDTRRQYRDPRFDPLVGRVDEEKASRAYAFLDEYREKEMSDLRAQIKKTKDANTKEDLKRQLQAMESRKKARKRKEEEDNLLKEHRRKEKELVAQGKTPFYLKRSEQKKQILVKRYEGMSKGQVDRAIERKRKKVAGKEKKELDWLQGARERG
ncbi:rRNA biogenesis protein rrp36 [Fusarium piperis]|uniref:rRNA biogenesis protein RRP36 n=1 Tax=Fusarium piperis TaxID=1435070 RepID=A0A9W9BSY7_9HYPO|nr:rRNA biogenesis protein rrp36 [Fusarium piperis]